MNLMITFAICDDELWMADDISARLTRFMEENSFPSYHISCFENGQALLASHCSFDLIFLDIQMIAPDGMETARRLRIQGVQSLLIFVTVLKDLVFDAFSVQAFDFLVKPLEDVRFHQTMERALKALMQHQNKTIFIQRGSSRELVPLSSILYGEVFGRKIYLHQKDGNVISYYGRLDDLEKQVDQRFFRCHRSYLVNLDYVNGCSGGLVSVLQKEKIPVSRLREREFIQALLRHMKERKL